MGHRLPRRVSDLGERLAALEERVGPHADSDGPTVGDILREHPDLAVPLVTLWERRHEPHDDLEAAAAAPAVWLTLRGTRFDDRPSTPTTEGAQSWH